MNTSLPKSNSIILISSSILIILFFYTAASKLLDAAEFQRQLANQNFPAWAIAPLLWLIPAAEILVSFLLLSDTTRKAGFYGSAMLMILFCGYVLLVLMNVFDKIPCSCGGVIRNMGFMTHFFFNLFFLALSLIGTYMSNSPRKEAARKQ